MKIKTIKQVDNLEGKRVLMRCDFNVPIKNGKVMDDFKIRKSLPTIEYLLKKKASVILLSHLGRPNGKVVKELSLQPVKNYLEKTLRKKIKLYNLNKLSSLKIKESITILENTRFSPDEKDNTGNFAKELASLADIYVVECFAVSHRPSASIIGLAKYLPAYSGLLMTEEIEGLEKLVKKPKKPFTVVLGGIKMETKIPVIKNLLNKANYILVGGGIVNTYLWAKGYKVGKSLLNKDLKKEALLYGGKRKVIMPLDLVVGSLDGKEHQVIKLDKNFKVKPNWGIYDIGPETIRLYAKYIKKAKTLVWNGAMGYFEQHPYKYGTHSVAQLLASRAKGKAFGVCGGGETVEVLQKLKIMDDIDLVSTGGGAMLEFLAGKKLPGVKIVTK